MNRRFYILIALLALIGWGIVKILNYEFHQGPDLGKPAPEFTLPDLQGGEMSLSSLRGKAVLVNFWGSWCGPCRKEMPSLEALYQRYRDQGLVVLGVSVQEEGWEQVREFLKVVPVSFPIVLDEGDKVSELYELLGVPETYFIDPDGNIADKVVGPQDYNQVVFFNKVERILPDN